MYFKQQPGKPIVHSGTPPFVDVLNTVLISATQEQQEQITTLSETNETLKQENQELKEELEVINHRLNEIMKLLKTQTIEVNNTAIQGSQK